MEQKPSGIKYVPDLVKLGIVAKQPKVTPGPIVNRPAADTRKK